MNQPSSDPSRNLPSVLRFLGVYAPALSPEGLLERWSTRSVFLTVVVRTQGRRPAELSEALLCLAAQDCRDFVVIVAGHDLAEGPRQAVQELIRDVAPMLEGGITYLPVSGGTRGTPIVAAAAVAESRYLAMLDDDDHVQADWVGRLRALSYAAPGRVLRLGAALRTMSRVEGSHARTAVAPPIPVYTRRWSLEEHLFLNGTPIHAFSVPLFAWDLGIRVDASLLVLEDWDLLLRSAGALGVVEDTRPVVLYNKQRSSGSEADVGLIDWHEIEKGIRDRHLAAPAFTQCSVIPWDPWSQFTKPLLPRTLTEVRELPSRVRHAIAAKGVAGSVKALATRGSRRYRRSGNVQNHP